VLKNADFLFESLFECPVAQLAWSGGSETSKVDLMGSPLIPISPSRAFAAILKGATNFTNSDDRKEGDSFICYL